MGDSQFETGPQKMKIHKRKRTVSVEVVAGHSEGHTIPQPRPVSSKDTIVQNRAVVPPWGGVGQSTRSVHLGPAIELLSLVSGLIGCCVNLILQIVFSKETRFVFTAGSVNFSLLWLLELGKENMLMIPRSVQWAVAGIPNLLLLLLVESFGYEALNTDVYGRAGIAKLFVCRCVGLCAGHYLYVHTILNVHSRFNVCVSPSVKLRYSLLGVCLLLLWFAVCVSVTSFDVFDADYHNDDAVVFSSTLTSTSHDDLDYSRFVNHSFWSKYWNHTHTNIQTDTDTDAYKPRTYSSVSIFNMYFLFVCVGVVEAVIDDVCFMWKRLELAMLAHTQSQSLANPQTHTQTHTQSQSSYYSRISNNIYKHLYANTQAPTQSRDINANKFTLFDIGSTDNTDTNSDGDDTDLWRCVRQCVTSVCCCFGLCRRTDTHNHNSNNRINSGTNTGWSGGVGAQTHSHSHSQQQQRALWWHVCTVIAYSGVLGVCSYVFVRTLTVEGRRELYVHLLLVVSLCVFVCFVVCLDKPLSVLLVKGWHKTKKMFARTHTNTHTGANTHINNSSSSNSRLTTPSKHTNASDSVLKHLYMKNRQSHTRYNAIIAHSNNSSGVYTDEDDEDVDSDNYAFERADSRRRYSTNNDDDEFVIQTHNSSYQHQADPHAHTQMHTHTRYYDDYYYNDDEDDEDDDDDDYNFSDSEEDDEYYSYSSSLPMSRSPFSMLSASAHTHPTDTLGSLVSAAIASCVSGATVVMCLYAGMNVWMLVYAFDTDTNTNTQTYTQTNTPTNTHGDMQTGTGSTSSLSMFVHTQQHVSRMLVSSLLSIIMSTQTDTQTDSLIHTQDVPTTTSPTQQPTQSQTHTPTNIPSTKPTRTPFSVPTHTPTQSPTSTPTHKPTSLPTHTPTHTPTLAPTHTPTPAPTQTLIASSVVDRWTRNACVLVAFWVCMCVGRLIARLSKHTHAYWRERTHNVGVNSIHLTITCLVAMIACFFMATSASPTNTQSTMSAHTHTTDVLYTQDGVGYAYTNNAMVWIGVCVYGLCHGFIYDDCVTVHTQQSLTADDNDNAHTHTDAHTDTHTVAANLNTANSHHHTLTHTLTHKRRKLLLEQQRLFTIAGYVGTTLWPILSACISLQAANTHTPTDIHITTHTSFAAASAYTQATASIQSVDTQDDPYVIYTITHDYWNTHIQTHLVGTLAGTLFFAMMCVMICLRVKSVLSPNMTFLQQSNAIIDYRHTLLLQQRQDSSVGATMPSMTVHTPTAMLATMQAVTNNPTLMMGSARANTQTTYPNANDTLIEMTTGKVSPLKQASSSSASALTVQSPHRSPLRTRTVGNMMSPSITQQLAIQAPVVRDEEETISDFDTMDLHTFTPDQHKRMFRGHDDEDDDDEEAVLDEDDVLGTYDRVLGHKK
jgi:hypothetical protein